MPPDRFTLILITGSTDGIGKLTALKLAKDGYEIYVHGRNIDKLSGYRRKYRMVE